MARHLLGKTVSEALSVILKKQADWLKENGILPMLAMVRIGQKPEDISYERGAMKRCASVGVACRQIELPEDIGQEALLSVMKELNQDDKIHGVLLFRPVPKHLDQTAIENALDPAKDVDCMTDASIMGVFTGRDIGFAPCTPQACLEILDHYGIDCTGKKAVVIGRSLVVGRPLAMMLMARNATVTVCHTKTKDVPSVSRDADIIISTVGKAGMIDASYVKPGQIVLDVGINVNEEGQLCGDVSWADVEPVVDAITPVPGGVGAVTSTVLAAHVLRAASKTL